MPLWVMGGVHAAREAILREIGEELRTHRKYAGWHRLFDVLRVQGATTVGRVADQLGKDYHGTYVQIGRLRRFVTAYSRAHARDLAATVELAVDSASDPPVVRLIVRPAVLDGQMLLLDESDGARLRKIVATFRRTLTPRGGRRLPARQVLALRDYAATAQDILDGIVWRNKGRCRILRGCRGLRLIREQIPLPSSSAGCGARPGQPPRRP